MSPHEKLVVAVIVGVVFAVTIAAAFHWWILDVRYWFRRPANLPGPALDGELAQASSWGNGARSRAGELDTDEWDELNPDAAADLLIAEWRDDSPGPARWFDQLDPRPSAARGLQSWHERMWWDDPDLTVWDARQAALRCWEILHIEFPRLRAELGIPA